MPEDFSAFGTYSPRDIQPTFENHLPTIAGAIAYLRRQVGIALAAQDDNDTSVTPEVRNLADSLQILTRLPHGVRQ